MTWLRLSKEKKIPCLKQADAPAPAHKASATDSRFLLAVAEGDLGSPLDAGFLREGTTELQERRKTWLTQFSEEKCKLHHTNTTWKIHQFTRFLIR